MLEKYSTPQSKFLECMKNNMARMRKFSFALDISTSRERFVKCWMKTDRKHTHTLWHDYVIRCYVTTGHVSFCDNEYSKLPSAFLVTHHLLKLQSLRNKVLRTTGKFPSCTRLSKYRIFMITKWNRAGTSRGYTKSRKWKCSRHRKSRSPTQKI